MEKKRKGLRWWQITLICVGAVVWVLCFPLYLGSWLKVVNSDTDTPKASVSTAVDAGADTQAPKPTEKPRPTPTPAPALIEVTAQELIDAYEENQLNADEKYEGEEMAITGFVEDIGENFIGQQYVTLNNGDDSTVRLVQCFLDRYDDDCMEAAKQLKVGDKITIIGVCEGRGTFNVCLADCTIK